MVFMLWAAGSGGDRYTLCEGRVTMPISFYGLLIGVSALIAIGSGAWLLLRARDVARSAKTPDNEIVPGRARRAPAAKPVVRLVLAINLVATCTALGLLVLIATGVIGSHNTRNDPYAQRP